MGRSFSHAHGSNVESLSALVARPAGDRLKTYDKMLDLLGLPADEEESVVLAKLEALAKGENR